MGQPARNELMYWYIEMKEQNCDDFGVVRGINQFINQLWQEFIVLNHKRWSSCVTAEHVTCLMMDQTDNNETLLAEEVHITIAEITENCVSIYLYTFNITILIVF